MESLLMYLLTMGLAGIAIAALGLLCWVLVKVIRAITAG